MNEALFKKYSEMFPALKGQLEAFDAPYKQKYYFHLM
jgi:hypothetical protein